MNSALQAASDELHRTVKAYWENETPGPGACAAVDAALADYERAKAEESKAVEVCRLLTDGYNDPDDAKASAAWSMARALAREVMQAKKV